MSDRSSRAKAVRRDPAILPDRLGPGAIALDRLNAQGLLDVVRRSLPLSRRGGYTAVAVAAGLIVYFLSGTREGLRPFFEGLDNMLRRRLAAVARLRNLPTAASISRALGGLNHDEVRASLDQILPAPAIGLDIFQHPSVHHLNALGEACHLIDIDPTVKASRERDVAMEEGMPPIERRFAGNPGYVGRHRGERRVRAVPAVHDGTSLWLAMRLVEVEGSIVGIVGALVDQCLRAMTAFNVAAECTVFRGDGEFGSVGVMQAFIQRGANFLVRIARYKLLNREEVLATLADATWLRVRGGESAIPRDATELGTCRLVGSTDDRPEVEVRVIATRIPCRSDEPDESSEGTRGVKRGAYRIELFATTLDPVRWPAPDLAELYAGRAAMENRLLQEDRELGLHRTISQNPAGQEWAWGLGLFLWNHLVCTGWRMKPPQRRQRRQDRRPIVEKPFSDAKVPSSVPVDGEPTPTASTSITDTPTTSAPTPGAAAAEPSAPNDMPPEALAIGAILGRAFADLDGKRGWVVDGGAGLVRCPNGARLKPFNLNMTGVGAPRLSVRTDPHVCVGCPLRDACFPVDRVGAYKTISRVIPHEEAGACIAALEATRAAAPPRPLPRRKAASPAPAAPPPTAHEGPWYRPPDNAAPGPWWAERPQFVPTEARHRARHLPLGKVVRVEIGDVVPLHREHPDVAETRARRAHRRRTYDEMELPNIHNPLTRLRMTLERRMSR